MDTGIVFNMLSIFISVILGLTTFFVADRRSRKNKYLNAKSKILNNLSKSLGEDNIPQFEIISSVIRSVLREENENNLDAITVNEVLDDLLRQILSDPFLDSNRRKELQNQIIVLLQQPVQKSELKMIDQNIPDVSKMSELSHNKVSAYSTITSFWKSFMSIGIGIIASIVAVLTFESLSSISFFNIDTYLSNNLDISTALIASIITAILSIIILILKYYDKKE